MNMHKYMYGTHTDGVLYNPYAINVYILYAHSRCSVLRVLNETHCGETKLPDRQWKPKSRREGEEHLIAFSKHFIGVSLFFSM